MHKIPKRILTSHPPWLSRQKAGTGSAGCGGEPPKGCPFVDRCDEAMKICKLQIPETTVLSSTHLSACWLNELAKRQGE